MYCRPFPKEDLNSSRRRLEVGKPVFNVYLKEGVDGFIVAECLEIPGCMSQGRTIDMKS
jgi:hypothetical protein